MCNSSLQGVRRTERLSVQRGMKLFGLKNLKRKVAVRWDIGLGRASDSTEEKKLLQGKVDVFHWWKSRGGEKKMPGGEKIVKVQKIGISRGPIPDHVTGTGERNRVCKRDGVPGKGDLRALSLGVDGGLKF